jgi:spore coat protein U-like protein
MTKYISRAAIAAAALALGVSGASALQNSGIMNVSADVKAVCTVYPYDLNFGSVFTTGGPTNGETSLTVSCVGDYTIALDAGMNTTPDGRHVKTQGGSTLSYALYQDAAHLKVWDSTELTLLHESGSKTIPVYGQLAETNKQAPGHYTDIVNVYINY